LETLYGYAPGNAESERTWRRIKILGALARYGELTPNWLRENIDCSGSELSDLVTEMVGSGEADVDVRSRDEVAIVFTTRGIEAYVASMESLTIASD